MWAAAGAVDHNPYIEEHQVDVQVKMQVDLQVDRNYFEAYYEQHQDAAVRHVTRSCWKYDSNRTALTYRNWDTMSALTNPSKLYGITAWNSLHHSHLGSAD